MPQVFPAKNMQGPSLSGEVSEAVQVARDRLAMQALADASSCLVHHLVAQGNRGASDEPSRQPSRLLRNAASSAAHASRQTMLRPLREAFRGSLPADCSDDDATSFEADAANVDPTATAVLESVVSGLLTWSSAENAAPAAVAVSDGSAGGGGTGSPPGDAQATAQLAIDPAAAVGMRAPFNAEVLRPVGAAAPIGGSVPTSARRQGRGLALTLVAATLAGGALFAFLLIAIGHRPIGGGQDSSAEVHAVQTHRRPEAAPGN